MDRYFELYADNALFQGVEEAELLPLLDCLAAQRREYARGEAVFSEGEAATRLGIVLEGRINTVYEDYFGGSSIIGSMGPGELFCDAFACAPDNRLPVGVRAQTDSTVLLIDIDRILHTCAHACKQHRRLSENLVRILAEKYIALSRKLVHLSFRTTRRKLLSYLSERQRMAGGAFTIHFNRQELADYLFVERSGLSTEWNRLKREGVLLCSEEGYRLRAPGCEK